MSAKNGGAKGRNTAPAVSGKAYPIIDHTYDVVVVGAGGAGLRATLGCCRSRAQDGVRYEGLSDAVAYGCRSRRRRCGAGQHGP